MPTFIHRSREGTRRGRILAVASLATLIALTLPGCNQKPIIAPVLTLSPAETMSHQIGHFDATEKVMVAVPGENGFLVFGPYADLEPGAYQATFTISVDGATGSAGATGTAGTVDVNAFTTERPESILGTADLKSGAKQQIALDFNSVAGTKYEFRVTSAGTATIRLADIVVKRRQ